MHFRSSFAFAGFLAWQAVAQSTTSSSSISAPSHEPSSWNAGAVHEFRIHPSCNVTERRQLQNGLAEAVALAEHAKQHVLRWGNASELYRKYFGNHPSGEVIGNFDKIANGDRSGMLFRCDDPDGNCRRPTYGGHWRGENATDETVICPRSFETRRLLVQMCALGYNVAEYPTNTFFASDLIHRLYHMPAVGEYHIEHYTETYTEVLDLAKNNASYSVHDSDSLQYFALDVYAHDIAVPGIGCSGTVPPTSEQVSTSSVQATSSGAATTFVTSAVPTVSATATTAEAVSVTSAIPPGCHTHADGALHCE